jgi:hypothetical protein
MNKLVLSLSVLFCLNVTAQKSNYYLSTWDKLKPDELKIAADKFICNNKTGLCYFMSNNNDNLVLFIEVKDIVVQNRILKEGMTVWINMDGKQEKDMGVRFPKGAGNTGKEVNLITALSMANTIELIGFSGESERQVPAENADSFSGQVTLDVFNVLQYRLVIPLTKVPLRNSKESNGTMPFHIGIEYGANSKAKSARPSVILWIRNVRLATGR